jgi:diguanylate cyclase (GGDEF)-like protein
VDIKTLLLIGMAIAFSAAIAMLVVWWTHKTHPGFGWWTSGLACEGFGTILFIRQPVESGLHYVLLSSGMLVLSLVLIGRGMLVFRQRRMGFGLEAGLMLTYVAVMGLLSVGDSNANARIAVYSLYLGVGSLLTVYWVLRRRPAYFGSSDVALAVSLSVQGVAALARAAFSMSVRPDVVNHMLDSDFQGYFLAIQVLTAMLLPLTLISMDARRTECDSLATQDQLRAGLAKSERHRAQMVAFNTMNERLLACSRADDAKALITNSLATLFGVGRAAYHEYGQSSVCAAPAAAHGFQFPLRMRDRPLGVVQVLVDDAVPSDELDNIKALATAVAESIKLALSHLELEDELRAQALRDGLTGLFNRRYLDDVLARELERCQRQGETLTVAMLDLDHFKRVNDDFGHEAGDNVLRGIGKLLLQWSRSSDIACRYGGEEFTLILQGSTPQDVAERLHDLLQQVARMQIEHEGNVLPPITVSIGVAQATPKLQSAAELLALADGALYQAKQQGRNRVVVAQ